jgi:3-hydroxybutyryl-CoA dehydrogenase
MSFAMFIYLAAMLEIKTICVCGAGTMGAGIAQVAAQAGFDTILFDVNEVVLEKAKTSIEKSLQKLVDKSKLMLEQKVDVLDRITFTSQIEHCIADVCIEAIIEDKNAKVQLFNSLAAYNTSDTIFATNTSSISIAIIAAAVKNSERVVGMHFFNPAPVMKLVEVIRTDQTKEGVIQTIVALSKKMNKVAVVCKDAPGFIVNRVARHYYLEAMRMVESGVVNDIATIDAIMQSTGFKMGPFALMDLIGIDINYNVSHIVWEALGKPERLKPSKMQREKKDAGDLGRKTGKGFYTY